MHIDSVVNLLTAAGNWFRNSHVVQRLARNAPRSLS